MNNVDNLKKIRKNDEFVRSIAKISVAQICENVGFQGFQQSALDTLSDILCKYIRDIGKTLNFYANLAGRTKSNVFDVIRGLEDLGLSQGGCGVEEICQYVGVSEEVGFAYSVPLFPVLIERERISSFFSVGETPRVDNVPSWLPCVPDPETYTCQAEMKWDIVDLDQKVVEPPLLKLEHCLVNDGFQVPVVGGNEQVNNPFLASSLEYSEKIVSLASLPERLVEDDVAQNYSVWAKHVSALGTFSSPVHGFKGNDFDIEEGSKKVVLERRPAVRLSFTRDTGKKSLATVSIHSKLGNTEAMFCSSNDDSRDDKKRRKENIVNESMENGMRL